MSDDETTADDDEELTGGLYPPYWNIVDADEIVLDGRFTYDSLKRILAKWEQYREREKAGQ